MKLVKLEQSPSEVKRPGERVKMSCIISGYSLTRKGLEWIGRAASGYTPVYKDSLRNKFSISTDSSSITVTLNGQNVQSEDSAVYYCARHSKVWKIPQTDLWGGLQASDMTALVSIILIPLNTGL
uniref:Ig-like domain-containing protein n=1 Tax=Amphilophus citrinellus TaxID=61819 RepID=A0A3Q0TDD8_AMPCI